MTLGCRPTIHTIPFLNACSLLVIQDALRLRRFHQPSPQRMQGFEILSVDLQNLALGRLHDAQPWHRGRGMASQPIKTVSQHTIFFSSASNTLKLDKDGADA